MSRQLKIHILRCKSVGVQSRSQKPRKGAALLEFALVAPLMILFTLGMIEMGRMTMVKHMLTNVSREGARMATLPSATNASVQAQVSQMLVGSNISDATITISPSSIATSSSGSIVTVSINVASERVSWLNVPLFMSGKTISASTSMRRESL